MKLNKMPMPAVLLPVAVKQSGLSIAYFLAAVTIMYCHFGNADRRAEGVK